MRDRDNSDLDLDLTDSTYASLTPSPPTMLDPDLDHIHELLVSLAKSAGDMLITASTFTRTFTPKANTADLVTETDHAIEHMLSTALAATYPDYKFLGEESHVPGHTAGLTSSPTFVVDPVDGTLNFVHGYPYTSISLAFVSKYLPLVGVVYNPFTRHLYTAVAGCGAHLHQLDALGAVERKTRLPLRQAPDLAGLQNALVAVEWGNERRGNNWAVKSRLFAALAASKEEGGAMVQSIRSLGSAALNVCAVADGTIDVYWQAGCWVWDVAAGWIILKEAGGIVASANPGDWEPSVDGRKYCFVRGAARAGQEEIVEEVWSHVKGRVEYPV